MMMRMRVRGLFRVLDKYTESIVGVRAISDWVLGAKRMKTLPYQLHCCSAALNTFLEEKDLSGTLKGSVKFSIEPFLNQKNSTEFFVAYEKFRSRTFYGFIRSSSWIILLFVLY